jgi:poly-gamma-glutamate synthesis protein (capsule biosynthesis protein)
VDVIIGGHPHVVQPAELLTSREDSNHRTLCVYSVGNLLSNQHAGNMDLDTGHTEDGLLFRIRLMKYSNGEVYLDSADWIPTWVCIRNSDGSKSYDILPLDPDKPDWEDAFSLTSDTLRKAEASYDRTFAILGDAMEDICSELDQIRTLRERSFRIFKGGVG